VCALRCASYATRIESHRSSQNCITSLCLSHLSMSCCSPVNAIAVEASVSAFAARESRQTRATQVLHIAISDNGAAFSSSALCGADEVQRVRVLFPPSPTQAVFLTRPWFGNSRQRVPIWKGSVVKFDQCAAEPLRSRIQARSRRPPLDPRPIMQNPPRHLVDVASFVPQCACFT